MYLDHYGLAEPPFSITPDPRFVYLSERHRDALAHLLFGIGQGGGGGFVQLTGEVGTGKTTLSRLLLEQVPGDTRVALILNPKLSAMELLETICEDLHVDIEGRRGSTKALVDALNAYLLDAYAQGLRAVLVIDEAQNLSVDALEQIRLLTNLETDTQKLLQIVLLGQPELRTMLARDDLRQLAQRITARFHLTPLDAAETGEYLRHRYRVAGGQRFPFSSKALRCMHQRSGGVPRLLNVIAERALLAGYARDTQSLDQRLVALAADEALPDRRQSLRPVAWMWAALGTAVVLAVALAAWWRQPSATVDTRAAFAVAAQPAAATPPVSPTGQIAVQVLDADAFATVLATLPASPLPAWANLLALWQQPATAVTVDDAGRCTAVSNDLHCIAGTATLDRLIALDRPLLLRVQQGTAHAWLLLRGADAHRARLILPSGTAVDVERTTLHAAWQGAYTGLWLGPRSLATSTSRNPDPAATRWLHARLPGLGDSTTAGPRTTARALREFQAAHGLAVTGTPDAETLMALAAEGGPHLLRELH